MTRSRLLGLGLGVVASSALVVSPLPAVAEEVPRLPRPTRSPATATATGTGSRSTAPRAPPTRASRGSRSSASTTPGLASVASAAPSRCSSPRTRRTSWSTPATGLRLTRLTGRKAYVLAKVRPKATRWRIMPRGSRSVVSYRAPGRGGWQMGRRSRRRRVLCRQQAADPAAAEARVRASTAARSGRWRSTTVNVLPLDRYLQGVVPREVPAEWPTQAVRAQAVAALARTPRSSGRMRRRTTTSATPSRARSTAEWRTEHPGIQRCREGDARQGRALPG